MGLMLYRFESIPRDSRSRRAKIYLGSAAHSSQYLDVFSLPTSIILRAELVILTTDITVKRTGLVPDSHPNAYYDPPRTRRLQSRLHKSSETGLCGAVPMYCQDQNSILDFRKDLPLASELMVLEEKGMAITHKSHQLKVVIVGCGLGKSHRIESSPPPPQRSLRNISSSHNEC
jgi:hypothetical protein